MGFLVSQHGQLGAIPPPPFLSVSTLESMRSGGAIPPPPHKRGISAILARYPMKTRKTRAIPPSAIRSRKGIARYGGVSRTGPLKRVGAKKFGMPSKRKETKLLGRISLGKPQADSFVTGSFRQALATRSSSARQTFVSIVSVFAILGKVFAKRSPSVCRKLPVLNVPV